MKNRSLLSEYSALMMLVGLLAFFWLIGQMTFFTFVIMASVTATLLLQLQVKKRLSNLSELRTQAVEKRQERQDIRSFRAQALNQLPSPILLIDGHHKIIFANDEASKLLGKALEGEDAYLFLRNPTLIKAIDAALGDERWDAEAVRYTTSSDRSFDITVAAVPNDKNSQVKQVMIFFYEVTSMLRTERMRVDFVANASHELRTPLSSVMGSIETLQGPAKDDPEGQTRFLTIMEKEAARMARLIDDLLSLSRIELERHKTLSTYIDLRSVVLNALSSVKAIGEKRGITFKADLPTKMPTILADEDQITQVLLNLLVNAAKYADPDTTVTVAGKLDRSQEHLTLSIRDEGPGIAPEHLARLTERFYRVDTARSRKMGGTGLGLAIVKHILLRHDSMMNIKSSLGQGTEFSFELKTINSKDGDTSIETQENITKQRDDKGYASNLDDLEQNSP